MNKINQKRQIYRSDCGIEKHRDYDNNLEGAKRFIQKIAKEILPGMGIVISGVHSFDRSRVEISYKSDPESKCGNFLAPILINQDRFSFESQLTSTVDSYFHMAKQSFKN